MLQINVLCISTIVCSSDRCNIYKLLFTEMAVMRFTTSSTFPIYFSSGWCDLNLFVSPTKIATHNNKEFARTFSKCTKLTLESNVSFSFSFLNFFAFDSIPRLHVKQKRNELIRAQVRDQNCTIWILNI